MPKPPQYNGIINLHKPTGMSSREAVDVVAKSARMSRVGHAGTLDPLATGVLVVCLGWATRLVPLIQDQPKRYRAEFLLGRRSDTDDITGTVAESDVSTHPALDQIETLLPTFVGDIEQVPPAYSAVHVAGRRAYDLARAGKSVDLAPRQVVVHSVEIIRYEYPRLELLISCGSGTYIRSIGRDLGEALGCGAVMSALVREAVGDFSLEQAVLPELVTRESIASHLRSPTEAAGRLPRVTCDAEELIRVRQGKLLSRLPWTESPPAEGVDIAILDGNQELVAIGEWRTDVAAIHPRQVFGVNS